MRNVGEAGGGRGGVECEVWGQPLLAVGGQEVVIGPGAAPTGWVDALHVLGAAARATVPVSAQATPGSSMLERTRPGVSVLA